MAHSSSVSSSCLLHVDPCHFARLSVIRLLWYLVPFLCNQAFRHVDNLLLTTCSATMFAMYLLYDPNGPHTAFLLFKPQCTGGVLAGTHWGALRCPGRKASGTDRQLLSAALLHCCSACADTCYQTEVHVDQLRARVYLSLNVCESVGVCVCAYTTRNGMTLDAYA